MVYIKSFVVALVATAVTAVCSAVVLLLIAMFRTRSVPEGAELGWDPISPHPILWLLPFLAVFCLSFLWEYRRVAK